MERVNFRDILITFLAASLFSFNSYAANETNVNDAATQIKWGYKGNIVPERWSQLDPSFALCATGKMQSPINIVKTKQKSDNKLTINYHVAPMKIVHDGVTDLKLGDQTIIIKDGHGIQLNFHGVQPKESITLAGETYDLEQFHFHSPSENSWHGQAYPLEIHFVNQGKDGKVAAIGVFVRAGAENPAIQKIVKNLPGDLGTEHAIKGEQINPMDLFPASKSYYSFAGSLTTPPCAENVQWVVMADSITASPAQIVLLRKAVGGDNARAVQPLNRRKISFSPNEQ